MIEGVAEIELTDVHTGKKEKTVENNMVTNALKYIYGNRMPQIGTYENSMIPVYGGILGGILVFDGEIEEDPENIIPPGNIECIAHAGLDAYNGGDERRGSYNEQESGVIENGIKFVWDFATNQGNGTIRSLCLTSNSGGKCGLGFKGIDTRDQGTIFGIGTGGSGSVTGMRYFHGMEYLYNIKSVSNNVITIEKYLNPMKYVSITADYKTAKLVEIINIKQEVSFTIKDYRVTKDGDYLYILCKESGSKKIHLTSYNTITGTNEQFEADITAVEGAELVRFRGEPYSDIAVMGEYLYVKLTYNGSYSVLKINTKNSADMKVIKAYAYNVLTHIGNRIYTENVIIDANDNVFNTYKTNFGGQYFYDMYLMGDKLFHGQAYGNSICIYSPYLATINNLQSPVIKTADKTMKITYTVREKME